ncbi:MAG: DNA replication initiation protein [Rhizobiales bacterium]|nr:DNA replication initiation protein [Hyphomicrobiales bacterium]
MNRSLSSASANSLSPTRTSPPEQVLRFVTLRVARDFGLDQGALLRPTRGTPQVAFARQVALYLTHVCFGLSFAAVGRMFHRDRTTVAHACRVIEDRRDDRELDRRLAALERACRRSSEGTDGFRGELQHSRPVVEAGR